MSMLRALQVQIAQRLQAADCFNGPNVTDVIAYDAADAMNRLQVALAKRQRGVIVGTPSLSRQTATGAAKSCTADLAISCWELPATNRSPDDYDNPFTALDMAEAVWALLDGWTPPDGGWSQVLVNRLAMVGTENDQMMVVQYVVSAQTSTLVSITQDT